MQIDKCKYSSPLGIIELYADQNYLKALLWKNHKNPPAIAADISSDNLILRQTSIQLDEYFQGKRFTFELPLSPEGTKFQKEVWEQLKNIPYGRTINYQDLAQKSGSPKAYQAVGSANGRNPISIIIPCHRVINKSGSLSGFAGGVEAKRFLLDHEKRFNSQS